MWLEFLFLVLVVKYRDTIRSILRMDTGCEPIIIRIREKPFDVDASLEYGAGILVENEHRHERYALRIVK